MKPIYFRVINDNLTVYDDPNAESKVMGKLKKGKIYAAFQLQNGWYQLDNDTYCMESPNYTVEIPVSDIIEMNGEYTVKMDAEVSGMSRHRRVNTIAITAKLIVFLNFSFIVMALYTMVYCWVYQESNPLDTLLNGYITLLTLILGLYIWTKKEHKLISMKKVLKKLDIADDDIDDQMSNNEGNIDN